jgi:hypothetical protein
VERVRMWRAAHPGYWRSHRRGRGVALQDGSGASADKSLRCTADAPRVTLVRNGKRLEIRHLGFQFVGLLSARESSQARNP